MPSNNVREFHQHFRQIFSAHVGMAYQEIRRGLEDQPGHIAIWGIEELQERVKKAWNVVREFDADQEIAVWHDLEQIEYALAFLHEAFSAPQPLRPPQKLLEIVFDYMSLKMHEVEEWAKRGGK